MTRHNFTINHRKQPSMSSNMRTVCSFTIFWMLFVLVRGQGFTDLLFTVDEGQPPGFLVGTIPPQSGYTYTFGVSPAEFTLDRDSGEITTEIRIDREQLENDVFDILVLATFNSRTTPIEVRIVVADLNDNSPTFPETDISISFTENGRVGSQMILESATDPDKAANGNIVEYSISEGNSEGAFRLVVIPGPDGLPIYIQLETALSLDHEQQNFYQLTISARDDGSPPRSGFLHLNISVTDVNDNPPYFEPSEFVISVNESTPAGTTLLEVHSTDRDSGINGQVEYFIDEDTSNFDVDAVSGNVTLQRKLNYVSSDPYQVTIKARDKGSPTLYGRAFLSVFVIDENDHDPQISFGFLPETGTFATVTEGISTGSIVALVTVTDEDLAENGEVNLQIIAGNDMGHFALEALILLLPTMSQASIFKVLVVGEIDRENVAEYNLTIMAWDNGTPRRQTIDNLLIHVVDTNDHVPEFQESEYHASLSEGQPGGSFVESVTATDADFGFNAKILYSITSGNDLQWFEINSETGLVTTKVPLNREELSVVVLNISATDQGTPPLSSVTTLTVTILDVNDEAPVFTNSQYTASVPENVGGRFEATTVTATDGDLGASGIVHYSLSDEVEHRYPGIFSIDTTSGAIFTETALDYEAVRGYDIQVTAFDSGSPRLESTVNVHIDVVDENDNKPVLYPQMYLETVQENGLENTFVVQVTATDADSGNYGNITYSIISGNMGGKFRIDGITGEIRTTGPLDREEESAYTLLIRAVDGGGNVAETQAQVQISVGDIQDNPPTFDRSVYEFEILENVNITSFVGQVTATSQDLNAQVSYLIFSGDPSGQFAIDANSGVIRTNGLLDRETVSTHELVVYADGGNMVGRATVKVKVLDVNDNTPQFPGSTDTADVVENWEVGRHFYHTVATDQDSPPNGLVVYDIVQNPDNTFGINHTTGWLFLNRDLQESSQDEYVVQILASDLGTPRLSTMLEVIITVRDVNNHAPEFASPEFETSISETTDVNSRFFSLTATDRDQGTNGMISYQILNGDSEDSFGIFPDGQVYVKNFLDREHISEYTLMVEAHDHGIPARTATTELQVEILDENDNRPFFDNSSYVFVLLEGSAINTVVGRIIATDRDLGENAELTYSLVGNQTQFSLDRHSGVITNLVGFDREALQAETGQSHFAFEAIVRDGGATPFQDRTSITVFVGDINDNPPVFSRSSYQATISELAENGTHVLRVTASDSDFGDNSYLIYSIVDGNSDKTFHIGRTSRQITLINSLDRETTAEYFLTIKAQDAGSVPQSALVEVRIDVLDENDHMPIFTQVVPELEVTECLEIGQPITMVSATDVDIGENGLISYSITGGDIHKAFRIDPDTGHITLSKLLDHETQSNYTLNITARDSGMPQQTSMTSVVVQVRDCNDNSPVFPQHSVVQWIDEEIALNTLVVTVTASDPDSGINGQVQYSIVSQEPEGQHFSINPENGRIVTNARIDHEYLKAHSGVFKLNVRATDQALPIERRRFATVEVVIFVRDINDNAPIFQTYNAVVIPRSSVVGSKVTMVTADDPDDGDNGRISYTLINRSVPFEIDMSTGEVTLTRNIEAAARTYTLIVNAEDGGQVPERTTSEVTILIIDDSDNGLIFSQLMYSGTVTENEDIGTEVVTVDAMYPSDGNAVIDYYITSVTARDVSSEDTVSREGDFRIMTSTGAISTGVVLDRELLSDDSMYTVTVYALDRTSTAASARTKRTQVQITVSDENDSPPIFDRPVYNANITEEAASSSPVTRLTAHDADIGSNAEISYSIISGNDGHFTIDPNTGQIRTSGQLDREATAAYSLGICASDGRQSTVTSLDVNLQDANDNDPVFSQATYSFNVPENWSVRSVIDAVLALDPDAGTNGEVEYSIVMEGTPGEDVFSLNSLTGEFILLRELDYEQKQVYFLTVRATDRGSSPRFTTADVYFNILDLNDNAPVFNPTSYWVEVSEDVSIGTDVVMVTASDADSGANAEVVFSISLGDPSSQFTIHPNGSISTILALDREMRSFYNLEITATDQASDPTQRKSSTAQVTIIVLDINDNAPTFTTGDYITIREDTSVREVVAFVHAVDPDVEKNSYIEYSLSPVPGDVFLINPVDGNIRLWHALDRETIPQYNVTVHATDKGQPSQSTSINLIIEVLDVNDNRPVFDVNTYHSSLPEDVPLGLEFFQVSAFDADEGINAELRFSIINGNYDSDFAINPATGILSVSNLLDHERRASYSLTVRAQDNGDGSRMSSATVAITIQDINDNAPVFLTPYTPRITENNQPAALVTRVSATDEDGGTNGQLTYRIQGNDYDGLFTIVPDTGEIHVTAALDREVVETYKLTLVAQDAGNPVLQGATDVTITVTDDNDNQPRFEFASYTTTLLEETGTNSPVLQVSATDADSTADLRYRLDSTIGNKFTIQPITGEILTTSGRLDREEQSSYDIVVTVEDGTTWSAQTTVTVSLVDINDNAPHFGVQSYSAMLPATTAMGTIVVAVEAQDADIGDNARLTYSITNGNSDKFTIAGTTGIITTAQALNSETGTYTLDVSAADNNPAHTPATVSVLVTFDASGQFPVIQSPANGAVYSLDETTAVDEEVVTLQATSPKTGAEATLAYYIMAGNIDNTFSLNNQSGRLTVGRSLDFEVTQRFLLVVEARDSSTQPLTSLVQIVVNVNDVNDNSPVFDQANYRGRVTEGQQAGTDVVQVHATDADSGMFGNVIYSLRIDGNTNNNFRIDTSTGWLQTNKVLDRETISEYNLMVQAEDQGSPAKTTLVPVHVAVDDLNDNEHSFTNLFSAMVPENSPIDSNVITITTSDSDILNNIRYAIIGDDTDVFVIDPITGQIRVNGTLDREDRRQYQLLVSAGDESFVKDTTVTITVLDVNDNAPTFSQPSYSVSLPEDLSTGSPAIQVSAQDLDLGTNQEIYYTMKTMSDHFSINQDTGYISIATPVSYIQPSGSPDPNTYLLEVLARDRGVPSLYSEVQVTVSIYDANEHPPVFQKSEYFSPVPYSVSVADPILQVVAVETMDRGQNAYIEYSVVGGNGSTRFDVEQDSGWIKAKLNLQADIGNYYNLIIEAKDQGRPSPRSTQVPVQLLVTGSNDFTPSFNQLYYQVSVRESLAVGLEVTIITANDDDTGVNGKLLYSIVSGNEAGLFGIIEDTGSLIVAAPLDYETFTSHTVQIKAMDQGWRSRENSTILTINLLDVDDNPPVFSPSRYDPQVAENSPSATYITTVTATDADTGTNADFTYDIIGGDGKDYFTVNPDSGVIRTQGNLDYEGNLKVFQLSVEAANEDTTMFGIAHVTVQLTGVNEYYPQFVKPSYRFSVSEAAADGHVAGLVYASDADQGPDGEVFYLLLGASNQQGFAIDTRSGEIVVSSANGQLDRETKDTVVLSVLAKNNEPITGDNVAEVQVTIDITDANDPPQFLSNLYQARISEDVGGGTYVTTVTALDYDQNINNRQFSYVILEGNHDGAFEIDANSGRITVASALDRESIATYRLNVGAVDTGNPPQTGYTEVVINLDDVNDNGPVLLPGNDVGYVLENEAINTIVMTLNATDLDLNSNPVLFTFSLIPNADSSSFTLESTTGVLRTTRTLDRETKSDYYLSVEIRDGATPEMTATSTIHVVVVDQNDNPSSARNARIEVQAYQSVFPGGSIGVVRPNDLDTGDVFVCQIVSGDSNVFSIQPGCHLNSRMHSTESQYALEITGDDSQHPAILSNFQVSFKSFNNDSLSNSITLRLSNAVPKTFLSGSYDRFSASVSSFLNSRESLLVLSLNSIESESSKMDLTLAITTDNGHLLREDVAKLITDNKATIMSQSGVTIDVVDYSPCSPNPCRNSGSCEDRVQLRHTTTITDSPSIIFVSPVIQQTFQCTCSGDFFGPLCEDQINQCDPEPCQNGGTCTDLIGDYSCSCAPGYTGNRCNTNIDDCAGQPCLNNGVCMDLMNDYRCRCGDGYSGDNCQNGPCTLQPCQNGGTCIEDGNSFRCECLFGNWGNICEITSVGFQQGSYMEFPGLSRSQNVITMQFTTVSPNALLVYNHDGMTTPNVDFLALEVVSGKLQLSYNLGDGITVITTDKMVADGQWHKVEARRNGKDGELIVDDCPPSQAASSCIASGGSGSQTDLDVNDVPLSLGGTTSIDTILPRAWQVSSADFLGCIRDVYINGQPLDLSSPLSQRGTDEGCDRDTTTCSNNPCGSAGVCVDEWWNHWCQCPGDLTGDSCSKAPTPFSFGSGSYVEYVVKESFQRQQLLDAAKASTRRRKRRDTTPGSQTISMSFRTGSPSGLLLLVESGGDFTTLQIRDNFVQFNYGSSGQSKGTVSLSTSLTNWDWHTVKLYREGATITLEAGEETKSQRFNSVPHDFTGLEVTGMSLGGTKMALIIDSKNITGFSGCLQEFKINNASLPLDGSSQMFDAIPSSNTGQSCDAVAPCLKNPCDNGGQCTPVGNTYTCKCSKGYNGENCKDAIVSNRDSTLVIALASVFSVVLIVIFMVCLLLLLRYRNKARKAKATAVNNAKNTYSMDSLDNPGFSTDTFDNPTMIGSQHNKTSQQPDIIEQNAFAGVSSVGIIMDSDDVVIGEEASGIDHDVPEHYDLENASSIAPSDIEPAYHYRYYHDGRERKPKRHGYIYSPNPMLARIGTPPCESPVSHASSSNHIAHNPNPSSIHIRNTPSPVQHSTPHEATRASPANVLARQSPALQLLKKESDYSAPPLRISRSNTPVCHATSPIGSEESYNQSELRSQGHHSDTSSPADKTHVSPMQAGARRPPRPPSRLKDPSRPVGLTVEDVKRLNTPRPDTTSGSHASGLDNLSSVSVNKRPMHQVIVPQLPSDLEPSPLLEPPDSSSSDETAGSFTCSEVDSDTEKPKARKLHPDRLRLSRPPQINGGNEQESETYEQFSAPFQTRERYDSVGGSLSTLFASEDENTDPNTTNGQFNWDQFLNWRPRFETLEGVFMDIAQLQDTIPSPPKMQVILEQTAEEFV